MSCVSTMSRAARKAVSGFSVSAISAHIVLGAITAASPAFVPLALAAAPTCNGLTATIYVDLGFVVGGPDNGSVYAGTLNGTTGADVMVGTTGADIINGGNNNDTICGLDGDDTIDSGSGINWIDAGDGANSVTAGTSNDTIYSGSGDDTINASGGTNVVDAGNGNNNVTGGSSNDTITTGSGNDTIDASGGTNIIISGAGNDTITGGSGNDTVTAGDGDDVMNVGGGTNNVTGGNGNDSMVGGSSTDTFDGGAGTDYCDAAGGSNTVTTCEASGNQGILVVAKDTTPDTPGQAFAFTGTSGITSVNGESSVAVVLSAAVGAGGTTYTAIESALVGWTLNSITCTADSGTSGNVGTSTATFKLNVADVLTCTFSNSQSSVATTTVLGSNLNPSTFNTNVTFTATVSGGTTPTGSVDLKDGATVIATQALVAGVATFNVSNLSVTTHSLTAVYGGDSGHTGSTSNTVSQVVNQAPTTTVLGSNLNPSTFNTSVTFTATVTGQSPTGTVDLKDGASVIATQSLVAGVATFSVSNLSVATHSLTAVYSGDTNNATSTSGTLSQVVNKAPTVTTLGSSLNPSMDTDTVTFTSTVTGQSPTGNVALYNGASLVDTQPLVAGTATFSVSGLIGGGASYSFTAQYLADTNNAVSTSSAVNQVVNSLPKLTVTKVVVNDNGGTQVIGDFPLFLDSVSVTSGVQNTTTVGAHVVTETANSQYAGSFMIGDCDSAGNITLALNDVKACVLTNDDIPATLTVIKQVVNDNGGTQVSGDFTMNVSAVNPTMTSFPGADTPGTDVQVDAGGYSVTETPDSGYTVSYSADCTGTMLPGDVKTCTITNDDIQPKLTVNKVVVNDNGGTKTVADFPLYVDSTMVDSGVQNGIDAGTRLVSEYGDPSTYAATITGDCDAFGNITMVPGGVYECTITNNDIAPTLTVLKQVVNENGGVKTVSDFTLMIDSTIVTSGNTNVLNVGTYKVTEVDDPDYGSVYRADCYITNGFITLGLGENKTCIIKNSDKPKFRSVDGSEPGNGGHSGHGVNRFLSAANFVSQAFTTAPGAFGGGDVSQNPFTANEKKYICAMQKTLETSDSDSLVDWLGSYMSDIMGRQADDVIKALKDDSFCASAPEAIAPKKDPVAIRVNAQGYVVSSNPVWNACVKGKATIGLIKSNTDKVMHRQGGVEVYIPLSCDDYHTNDRNEWRHPDHPELLLSLDKKGKLAGSLPSGFIAVKDGAAPNVAAK